MAELLCTVIVPVYNGAATIEDCLSALAQQTIPAAGYEVIIVDDGSRDGTAARVQGWQRTHPGLRMRLLQQQNGGPAAARNAGAAAAQAPILLFTDADCRPAPDWVATLVSALRQPGVTGVKGVYRSQQAERVAQFIQAEYEERYERMARQPEIDFIDTYAAGYWRSIFLENGGFDSRLIACEDQEFSFRLAAQGHRLYFVPVAWVEHRHVTSVIAYARRKYAFGYWKARLTRWHPQRLVHDSHTPQRVKVQMGLALVSLALGVMSGGPQPLRPWARWGVAVSALTFVLSAADFLSKLARKSRTLALLGVGMLIVRALALSAGFLTGTVRFVEESPADRQARPQTVLMER